MNVKVFDGYVWYACAISDKAELCTLRLNYKEVIQSGRDWRNDGVVLITENESKPVVEGWDISRWEVPEGWGGKVGDYVVRHVHTYSKNVESVFALFVGVVV